MAGLRNETEHDKLTPTLSLHRPSTDPYSWSGALSVVYMFYGAGLVTPGGGWDCKLLDQATVDATANQLVRLAKKKLFSTLACGCSFASR